MIPFRQTVIVLCWLWISSAYAGPSMSNESFSMTFDRVPLQQLAMVFYDQCEKRGLVFDPAVSKLDEVLTLRTPSLPCASVKTVLVGALERAGVAIESHGSYDLVRLGRGRDDRDEFKELIYRPRFRDAVELAEMSMIAVRRGSYAHQRRSAVVQAGAGAQQVPETGSNGASMVAKLIDKLVFVGPEEEVSAVQRLLSQLDVPNPQIEISVGIYEFQSSTGVGSAVNAAMTLFNSKIGLTLAGGASAGSSLKLKLPSIDAALSLLDEDSRFRYVAQPRVLAKDGEQVTFTSGQDVRVVGSVSVDRNGNQVQSIVTMNAGVTLQATPLIRGDVVDLALHQVVSDFVSSPNSDPSVVKRDITSRLVLQPGFVYIIGGLQTTRKTQSKRRFLGFGIGDSFNSADTEIIVLLSVKPDVPGV
jgi:type II secretory pathway component GspD/PulD (secretin)